MDLERLAALAERFTGGPVQVEPRRCLNVRHRDAGCRLCAEACPVEAITVAEDPLAPVVPAGVVGVRSTSPAVTLDEEVCANCGLCLRICPTGVFSQPGAGEDRLRATVAALPSGEPVELACPLGAERRESRLPEGAVVATPRCLAALDVPLLLTLALDGHSLWLNDALCADCPLGAVQPAIVAAAQEANGWLGAFGRGVKVCTYTANPEGLLDRPRPVRPLAGEEVPVSRRDFFRALAGLVSQAAATVVAAGLPQVGEDLPQPMRGLPPKHVPAQRRRLQAVWRRVGRFPGPVPTADLPIAALEVASDRCTACTLCARFCPTGALEFRDDGASFVLFFRAGLCVDCRLCLRVCPTEAITCGEQIAGHRLLAEEGESLVAGRLAPCRRCEAPTNADVGDGLCYVCLLRPDSLAGLRDLLGP